MGLQIDTCCHSEGDGSSQPFGHLKDSDFEEVQIADYMIPVGEQALQVEAD